MDTYFDKNELFQAPLFPIPSQIPTYIEENSDTESDSEEEEEYDSENESDILELHDLAIEVLLPLQHVYIICKRIYVRKSTFVYSAIKKDTRERVVLKITLKLGSKYYLKEVMILDKLKECKSCPTFIEFYKFELGHVIVMKYYKEDNLPFKKPVKIKKLMTQLLTTIKFIHEKGILYRDLKLSNMIWSEDVLTLIDFDISTFNNGKHTRYAFTEGYEAPVFRQLENESKVTYGSEIDIWSCGVVFGMLLKGIPECDITFVKVKKWIKNIKKKKKKRSIENDLLMLMLSPKTKRPSASELLNHLYFVPL
jgi:serine/threonine protein kinase